MPNYYFAGTAAIPFGGEEKFNTHVFKEHGKNSVQTKKKSLSAVKVLARIHC